MSGPKFQSKEKKAARKKGPVSRNKTVPKIQRVERRKQKQEMTEERNE